MVAEARVFARRQILGSDVVASLLQPCASEHGCSPKMPQENRKPGLEKRSMFCAGADLQGGGAGEDTRHDHCLNALHEGAGCPAVEEVVQLGQQLVRLDSQGGLARARCSAREIRAQPRLA